MQYNATVCKIMKTIDPRLKIAIHNIVWMARRYADGRRTYAPEMFNESYKVLKEYMDFDEENDPDNRQDDTRPIKNFPYATRGEYK